VVTLTTASFSMLLLATLGKLRSMNCARRGSCGEAAACF
jgi:hypothetical protein